MNERSPSEGEPHFDLGRAISGEMKRFGLPIVQNRILSRPPIDPELVKEGIITSYDFDEKQDPQTGLFPYELKKCQEIWDACDYLSHDEKVLLLPAFAYTIFGHQEQWRDSGRPTFEHLADVAIEAAGGYRAVGVEKKASEGYRAKWWVVAAGLLHDLHEDSKKHGHEVTPERIELTYAQLGNAQEGSIIARTMRAMTKFGKEPPLDRLKEAANVVFLRQRPIPNDIRTIMRLYDTILDLEGTEFGDEAVILLKLIDRKKNLETIQYLKPEKRERILRQTLQIYVPMAEAFHLHKLRDEPAHLVIERQYPEMYALLKKKQEDIQSIHNAIETAGMVDYIGQTLKSFAPIGEWYDKAPPKLVFSVPSIYDFYKAEIREKNPKPHLKFQILLPELPEETDAEWNARALSCYQVLAEPEFADLVPREINPVDVVRETRLIPGKFLHYTFRNSDVDFRTTFLSVKQRIADHASIIDLITFKDRPDIGTISDWQEAAWRNLQDVKRRYMEARKQGNLEAFFNTIADERILFDEKGNSQHFPPNASILDVVSVLYGQDAFYVKSVRIKDISGHTRNVSGRGLYETLQEAEQIVGLGKASQETIEPAWLDNVCIDSVREVTALELERLGEKNKIIKEKIIKRGDEVLQAKLAQAWEAYLGYVPYPDTQNMHLKIPPRHVFQTFEGEYTDESDLLYHVGINKADEMLINRVIAGLVQYRKGVHYLEMIIPDSEGATEQFLAVLRKYGVNSIRNLGQAVGGGGGIGKSWFHESELGSIKKEMESSLRKIITELKELGFQLPS